MFTITELFVGKENSETVGWRDGEVIQQRQQTKSYGVEGSSYLFPGRKRTQTHCGLAERRRGCFRGSRQSFRCPWPGCNLSLRQAVRATLASLVSVISSSQRAFMCLPQGSPMPGSAPAPLHYSHCRNTGFWSRGAERVLYGSVFFYFMVLLWSQPSIMGEVSRLQKQALSTPFQKAQRYMKDESP